MTLEELDEIVNKANGELNSNGITIGWVDEADKGIVWVTLKREGKTTLGYEFNINKTSSRTDLIDGITTAVKRLCILVMTEPGEIRTIKK